MITVIGIFENAELADEASSYLLANEFENENIDVHTSGSDAAEQDRVGDFFNHIYADGRQAAHYASLGRQGTVVTVHAISAREAQEAVDVLNNYGAVAVNATEENPGGAESRSQVIERIIAPENRLR
ncbi:MAG: hypothetical protein M3O71_31530 [Bacteroidota bacterium]|nr:hypothetical protein [Bacteroidota bacterium]